MDGPRRNRPGWRGEAPNRLWKGMLTSRAPCSQLTRSVVSPTQKGALADPTGVLGTGGKGLEGAGNLGGCQPIHLRSLPQLAVSVQPPTEGPSPRREATSVVPPCHEASVGVVAGDGDGATLICPGPVPQLSIQVPSPAGHSAEAIQPAGMGQAHSQEGIPDLRGHRPGRGAVRLRAVTHLPGFVRSPAPRLP